MKKHELKDLSGCCKSNGSCARQSRFGKPHASYYFKQQSVPKGFVFIKQGEKTNDTWRTILKLFSNVFVT